MLNHRRSALLLLVAALLSTGCSTLFPTGPDETLPSGPAQVVSAGEVATFPDGAARLSDVEVWRDREPVAGQPPPCVDLCASVDVVADGFESGFLEVTELWVVRGSTAARFGEVQAEPSGRGLVVTGRRGPDVDLSEPVRIVARVRRSSGAQRVLRSDAVSIEVRG